MQQSRFVFLALAAAVADDGTVAEATTWMLVSPNNRPLGRSARAFDTYGASRDAVLHLRAGFAAVRSAVAAVESSGQWVWRVEAGGTAVAVSSRSYLRARECHYNLERFLEAVPEALVVTGTRSVRGGHLTAPDARGDTAALLPRGARLPPQGPRLLFGAAPKSPPA